MRFKFVILLTISFYIVCLVISNLLSPKLFDIHGIYFSAGTFTVPIAYSIVDSITEVFGYRSARNLIWAGAISELFFSSMVTLIANSDVSKAPIDQAYALISSHLLRGSLAFFVGSIIGLSINSKVLAKLKIVFNYRFYILRAILSSSAGELIYIIITFAIAFLGIFTVRQIFTAAVVSYLYKIVLSIVLSYPSLFLVKLFSAKIKDNSQLGVK